VQSIPPYRTDCVSGHVAVVLTEEGERRFADMKRQLEDAHG
jgi:hypothetical protein